MPASGGGGASGPASWSPPDELLDEEELELDEEPLEDELELDPEDDEEPLDEEPPDEELELDEGPASAHSPLLEPEPEELELVAASAAPESSSTGGKIEVLATHAAREEAATRAMKVRVVFLMVCILTCSRRSR
jgi:hypothetical protein